MVLCMLYYIMTEATDYLVINLTTQYSDHQIVCGFCHNVV